MKYSITYKHGMEIKDDMKLVIYYANNNEKLINFIQSVAPVEVDLVLNPVDINDFFNNLTHESLNKLAKDHPNEINFSVSFPYIPEDEFLNMCHFPYGFTIPIDSFNKLQYVTSLGVSSVIIDGDLMYYLSAVREYADKNKLEICAYTSAVYSLNSYKDFFILPGDVDRASHYIDTLLLPSSIHYSIYSSGKFKGDVSKIVTCPIGQYNDEDPFLKMLFDVKAHCGLKCLKGKVCNYCDNIKIKHEIMVKENAN